MSWLNHQSTAFWSTLYWTGFRGRLGGWRRELFHVPTKRVPLGSLEGAVLRYGEICRRLLPWLESGPSLEGARVCELGAGNCLATSALFLGLGARRVEVFEPLAPALDARQREVLAALRAQGLPLQPELLLPGDPPQFDPQKMSWHRKLMEDVDGASQFDLIFSFSVMEHVEALGAVLKVCHKALKPGGRMFHVVDLGGHDQFEDPMPPLDFQVYPDWVYSLMYPRYGRATRQPVTEYVRHAKAAGFSQVSAEPIRVVDDAYLNAIWPKLNRRLRREDRETVRTIEFILAGTR